jgi:protein-disulfide isomerase
MSNKTSSSSSGSSSSSKRKQIQQQRQKKEQQRRIFIVLMIAGVALVIMAVILIPNLVPAKDVTAITPVARPQVNGREMGSGTAPVVVEVFSDFQCPACRTYAESIEPLLVNSYVADGRVRYIYRQFPFLDDRVAKKESDQAANASMCAADQGKFWDFHDIIFANWNGENQGAFSDKRLVAMAESLGLDMGAFQKCFNSNQFKGDIEADLALGQQYGVNSTPSVFVNGVMVESPDPTLIQQAIEAALASSN